jgi:hypothetical protein
MRRTLASMALLLSAVTIGLAETPEEAAKDSVLIPLTVGNNWTMQITGVEGQKAPKDLTVTLEVTEQISLAGTAAFRFGPREDDDLILMNGAGGLHLWDEDDAKSHLVLPYPAKIGDVHAITSEPFGDGTKVHVVDTRAHVAVDGTVLECYHYRIALDDDELTGSIDIYVAPNHGVMRLDVVMNDADGFSNGEVHGIVTKYSVNGTPQPEPRGTVD